MIKKLSSTALVVVFTTAAFIKPVAAPWSQSAIVVFTGGEKRVETGLRVFMGGKGDRLLITGYDETRDAATLMRDFKITPTRDLTLIEFDRAARDTLENARNTNAWMRQRHVGHVTLVTSNDHIGRSMLMLTSENPVIGTRFSACSTPEIVPDTQVAEENLKYTAVLLTPKIMIPESRWWREAGKNVLVKFVDYLPSFEAPAYSSKPC